MGFSQRLFKIIIFIFQAFHFIPGGIPQGLASQSIFTGFEKGFGPFVIDRSGNTFTAADFGDGHFAPQAFENDSDFILG